MLNEIEDQDDAFYMQPSSDPNVDDVSESDFAEEEDDSVDLSNPEMTEQEEKEFQRLSRKKRNQDYILRTFRQLKVKPSEEEIAAWKRQYGTVYVVSLSEDENYVFRALNRQEWKAIKSNSKKLDEDQKTDVIAIKGTIWPRLNSIAIASLPAGTAETLMGMILEASNFMSTERAIELVRKL